MRRPIKDRGGFVSSVLGSDSNSSMWAIHKLQVESTSKDINSTSRGRAIREFGGFEKINRVSKELDAPSDEFRSVMEKMGTPHKRKVLVTYDIIPPATEDIELRLIFNVFEEISRSERDINTQRDAPITSDFMQEQGNYLKGELEKEWSNNVVKYIGSGATCEEPTPEEQPEQITFISI